MVITKVPFKASSEGKENQTEKDLNPNLVSKQGVLDAESIHICNKKEFVRASSMTDQQSLSLALDLS